MPGSASMMSLRTWRSMSARQSPSSAGGLAGRADGFLAAFLGLLLALVLAMSRSPFARQPICTIAWHAAFRRALSHCQDIGYARKAGCQGLGTLLGLAGRAAAGGVAKTVKR